MYSISEIRKQNNQKKTDLDNARDGTFCILRHGGVLIRSIRSSKTLEGRDAKEFLDKVKDKGTGYVKQVVNSYFPNRESIAH